MGRGIRWIALAAVALAVTPASASILVEKNVVDLVRESEAIVVATVDNVTDGFDTKGTPYTEVTLCVSESIRGDVPETYTFRQFGLVHPRPTQDGKWKMMPAPDVFPRYAVGEQVLLFLSRPAAKTGLRTTAGLSQGKFVLGPGHAENGTHNEGLFRGVHPVPGLVTDKERAMLATASGTVHPDTLLSFVRRAVKDRWVETGRLTGGHAR